MTFSVHRFEPPSFVPHRWRRGGHLQTLLAPRATMGMIEWQKLSTQIKSEKHRLPVSEGDTLILHDDMPAPWVESPRGSVLLLHGICGCHAADYMVRFTRRLLAIGVRVFRLDMRGCGESVAFCRGITHAGRSDDVLAAIEFIASLTSDRGTPIGAVGTSLGGNQLLRAAGRVGAGLDARPSYWDRVGPIVAIAPPIDLQACSDRMEAWSLRFYNHYFITQLLRRAKSTLQMREELGGLLDGRAPKTLREFDRRITAPMAGFADERSYYAESSAHSVVEQIDVPALIVTAADDPLVPVDSFVALRERLRESTRVLTMPTGGHHGYTQLDGTAWTDELIAKFYDAAW
ncbi:Hydrolase, alpha/beta fold family functionally coupled to Phosphoribulokinase [Rhodopirellula islandica]|uniref:Hydrolase, alpha/beta fold family functionally coupled to Phosphoribulokinase n=2 Tax=Rhodopirellula islandica TaxID=595434 RepID=A0A0J1B4V5_RHOIS|nr:Hydrolase, alpha/beta fold family functionally coupled to Phosphoribulokinase [Rhodopirellula islandica]